MHYVVALLVLLFSMIAKIDVWNNSKLKHNYSENKKFKLRILS